MALTLLVLELPPPPPFSSFLSERALLLFPTRTSLNRTTSSLLSLSLSFFSIPSQAPSPPLPPHPFLSPSNASLRRTHARRDDVHRLCLHGSSHVCEYKPSPRRTLARLFNLSSPLLHADSPPSLPLLYAQGIDNGWWGTALGLPRFNQEFGTLVTVDPTTGISTNSLTASEQSAGTGLGQAGVMIGESYRLHLIAELGLTLNSLLQAALSRHPSTATTEGAQVLRSWVSLPSSVSLYRSLPP